MRTLWKPGDLFRYKDECIGHLDPAGGDMLFLILSVEDPQQSHTPSLGSSQKCQLWVKDSFMSFILFENDPIYERVEL